MIQEWTKVTLNVPGDLSDLVSCLLFEAGTNGIQVEDGEDRTWVRMEAYFEKKEGSIATISHLRRKLGALGEDGKRIGPLTTTVQRDGKWGEKWKEFFRPEKVTDRILVGPPWGDLEVGDEEIAIVIEPKMAFGTGRHESTRIVLKALERFIRPGDRVMDLGTGSGILSIVAAKLGAECVALDIDPVAIENARENTLANDVSDRVRLICGTIDAVVGGRFDAVAANIQRSVLIPLLDDLHVRLNPGGRLILSGILDREEVEMGKALGGESWASFEVLREGQWIGMVVEKVG